MLYWQFALLKSYTCKLEAYQLNVDMLSNYHQESLKIGFPSLYGTERENEEDEQELFLFFLSFWEGVGDLGKNKIACSLKN